MTGAVDVVNKTRKEEKRSKIREGKCKLKNSVLLSASS